MNKLPLVSIIIPTKNSAKFIGACIKSILNQSFKNIEIIVVDNRSNDETKKIVFSLIKPSQNSNLHFFTYGPERSAQRNYGAKKSKGKYVFFIDSDMELTKNVIKECVVIIDQKNTSFNPIGGIIIPEKSVGKGFWAKCKTLEKEMYMNVDWIEAARFFNKKIFWGAGGFDIKLTGPEDWDLSQRIKKISRVVRSKNYVFHNEEQANIFNIIGKKYYYAKNICLYRKKHLRANYTKKQTSLLERYRLFLSKPRKFFKKPLVGIGLLFIKTLEYLAGGLGYIESRLKNF